MRLGRPIAVALSLVILAWGAVLFVTAARGAWSLLLGVDLSHYLDGVRRWMATGSPYLPWEVAQPFDYEALTFLHPPIALLLFAPFLVLPAPLWWLPVPVVAWRVWRWRPAVWAWPLLALLVANPRLHSAIFVGNTDMWIVAAVALGLRFGWPALLVVVKPSLFPFLLAGAHRRSFWLGIPVVAALCVPFGLLWIDWLHVVDNAPNGIDYSFGAVPLVLIPVVAWASSRERRVAAVRDETLDVVPVTG